MLVSLQLDGKELVISLAGQRAIPVVNGSLLLFVVTELTPIALAWW